MIRRAAIGLLLCLSFNALFAGPIELDKRERDRLKKETLYAIDLIQRYHYKQTSFADIDSAELLRKYMRDLDGSSIFFLQEDVDFMLERFSGTLKPAYLYVGDLFPAFEIYNLYQKRVGERIAWVRERLKQPFDLEGTAEYLADREDAPWPQSKEEADALWASRLTNEIIMELLENEPQEQAVDKIAKRYDRMEKFMDEIEVHNVQETFLTSLAQLYDPHSTFFSWDSAQEFDIQISNSLVGIGAQLRDIDGYCVIERLMPGSPAEMTGKLHPGDKIVAVAQGDSEPVDVVGMKLRKIVQMIRGETGTEVRLTVIPAHSAARKVVSLKREKVELTANLANGQIYELPDDKGVTRRIGVIDLPSFYGEGAFGEGSISTSRDVAELISKLKAENMEGLVLDLRNNGGGRLDEAIKLTGLFISQGPVVMKRSFDGGVEEDWDRDEAVAWDGPLVVLVSRSSASASEIVAGALQSLGRAVVVGDQATHGKGTVQAPIDLRSSMRSLPFASTLNVGTVKITVQQFFLPNGDSTQNRGILSDIALPSVNMFMMEGEADLENALAWDHIAPIVYELPERKSPDFSIVSKDLLDHLAGKSRERQQSFEEFDFLNRNITFYKERHDQKSVSLNLAQRRAEKERIESTRDQFDDQLDALSSALAYASRPVELDLTTEKERAHQQKLVSTPLPDGGPRANRFYQKVFYYQAPGEEKIHEIWVEYFDYEKALPDSAAFAELLTGNSGIEVSADEARAILTSFKNRDRGSDFNVMDTFAEVLGERFSEEAVAKALPAFYARMVEVNPDILLERPKLDIPLRESLRVVRDWIQVDDLINPARIAASAQ